MDTPHIPHGTDAGYQKHLRTGREPCDRCRKAHAAYNLGRRITERQLGEYIDLLAKACKEAGMY